MKIKNKLLILCVSIIIICLVTACGSKTNTEIDKNKLTVAVSIVPQHTFVKKICGDKVNIVTVIPIGASPENYDPSPKERANFSNADVFFTIGVPSEETFILPYINKNTIVKNCETEISKKHKDLLIGDERDPHIWLSPKRMVTMAEYMRDTMCEIDSENAEFYKKNAESFISEINSADTEIKSILKDSESKSFLVFHPAFQYFADDYGLKMIAFEHEGKDITAKRLTEMIDIAKKENIKVIFHQAEITSDKLQAFADEIGGKTVELYPLSENYIDNLLSMAKAIAQK